MINVWTLATLLAQNEAIDQSAHKFLIENRIGRPIELRFSSKKEHKQSAPIIFCVENDTLLLDTKPDTLEFCIKKKKYLNSYSIENFDHIIFDKDLRTDSWSIIVSSDTSSSIKPLFVAVPRKKQKKGILYYVRKLF